MNTAEQFIDTPLGQILIRAGAPEGSCVSIQLMETEHEKAEERVTAALLHVKTTSNICNYFYECIWMNEPPEVGYGIGQHIETWQKNGYCLTMSTEDLSTLSDRLPYAAFRQENPPIRHTERGIVVQIPYLPAGTDTTLHFITAWEPTLENGDCRPSASASIPHKEILVRETSRVPITPS